MSDKKPFFDPRQWVDKDPNPSTQVIEEPPELAFAKVLEGHGFELKDGVVGDGEIHRCHVAGDKGGSVNGWFVLFVDRISNGAFGSWKDDFSSMWCSKNDQEISESERAIMRANIEAAKVKAKLEREAKHNATAIEARERFNQLDWVHKHDYLTRKQVDAFGLKVEGEALVVPIKNAAGELRSLQTILANGKKKFLAGGEIAGNFHLIGSVFTEPTYIVEGYATGATIHEATKASVVVAFNAGNLKPVLESLRNAGNTNQFIIAADRDQSGVGEDKAKGACEAVFGCSYIVPTFTGSTGSDFNDLGIEQGLPIVQAQLQGLEKPKNALQLIREDHLGEIKPTDWLVEDFLTTESFASMFGASGSFKSFCAIDMGLCVASGRSYHGHTTRQSNVAYICGEGANGINKRVSAWKLEQEITEPVNFFMSSKPVAFMDANAVNELRAVLLEVGDVDLVIIDTLNRNFGAGDENRTEDMTLFVDACTYLIKEFKCNVLVVHHTGLGDSTRARGSSALRAALDTELCVERTAEGLIALKTTKQKDEEEIAPVLFKPKVVEVARVDGIALTSCVMELDSDPKQESKVAESFNTSGNRQAYIVGILNDFEKRILDASPDAQEILIKRKDLDAKMESDDWSPDARSRMKRWARDVGLLEYKEGSNVFYKYIRGGKK